MLKININTSVNIKFQFPKYIKLILAIIPNDDVLGINEIAVVDSYSDKKCLSDYLACYIPNVNGKDCLVEVCIGNLLKDYIPEYLFNDYPEIAALRLSRILAHEIGHHAHYFKRHKIRKKRHEKFADQYAEAGYYNYYKYRTNKIIWSYRIASWNFFQFEKEDRKLFSESIDNLIKWADENSEGIYFP